MSRLGQKLVSSSLQASGLSQEQPVSYANGPLSRAGLVFPGRALRPLRRTADVKRVVGASLGRPVRACPHARAHTALGRTALSFVPRGEGNQGVCVRQGLQSVSPPSFLNTFLPCFPGCPVAASRTILCPVQVDRALAWEPAVVGSLLARPVPTGVAWGGSVGHWGSVLVALCGNHKPPQEPLPWGSSPSASSWCPPSLPGFLGGPWSHTDPVAPQARRLLNSQTWCLVVQPARPGRRALQAPHCTEQPFGL